MPTMTIEAQLQHIAEYRHIIDSLKKRRPLAEYDKRYIIDLERSITGREEWIKQERAKEAYNEP